MKAFNLAVNLVGNPLNCFFPSNNEMDTNLETRRIMHLTFSVSVGKNGYNFW